MRKKKKVSFFGKDRTLWWYGPMCLILINIFNCLGTSEQNQSAKTSHTDRDDPLVVAIELISLLVVV